MRLFHCQRTINSRVETAREKRQAVFVVSLGTDDLLWLFQAYRNKLRKSDCRHTLSLYEFRSRTTYTVGLRGTTHGAAYAAVLNTCTRVGKRKMDFTNAHFPYRITRALRYTQEKFKRLILMSVYRMPSTRNVLFCWIGASVYFWSNVCVLKKIVFTVSSS